MWAGLGWAGPDNWAERRPKKEGQYQPKRSSFFLWEVGLDPAKPFGLGQNWPGPIIG
jgi:hypothetical protein